MNTELIYRRTLNFKKAADELRDSIISCLESNWTAGYQNLSKGDIIASCHERYGEGNYKSVIKAVRVMCGKLQVFLCPVSHIGVELSDELINSDDYASDWVPLEGDTPIDYYETLYNLAVGIDEINTDIINEQP